MSLTVTENKLIEGDPMDPSSTDIIVQTAVIRVPEPIPGGWRVAYRYEIEEEANA